MGVSTERKESESQISSSNQSADTPEMSSGSKGASSTSSSSSSDDEQKYEDVNKWSALRREQIEKYGRAHLLQILGTADDEEKYDLFKITDPLKWRSISDEDLQDGFGTNEQQITTWKDGMNQFDGKLMRIRRDELLSKWNLEKIADRFTNGEFENPSIWSEIDEDDLKNKLNLNEQQLRQWKEGLAALQNDDDDKKKKKKRKKKDDPIWNQI